jgi:hypothetical protein
LKDAKILKCVAIFKLDKAYNARMHDDPTLATHYRNQASRLRALAAIALGVELKADLLAAARMYEGFAEQLEKPTRLTAGIRW